MDETHETLNEELDRLKVERDNLVEYSTTIGMNRVKFTHQSILAAVDGKVQNEIYDNNWSARCPYCWATPDDVIDGDDSDFEEQDDVLDDPDESPGQLHYIINTGKTVFKAGTRNQNGTRKYQFQFDEKQAKKVETRYVSYFFIHVWFMSFGQSVA